MNRKGQNMEKRTETLTVRLTKSELDFILSISEHNERKPSEQARILLLRECGREWAKIQEQEHPTNKEPFKQVEF